ncbi:MAG: hypothetical protein KJP09_08560 [Bacteroidia bacterium]|nr:hypothetical protein [Bacteroidia bacterium]NND10642.1 hypothetical protein [Flavobacteriaceae bacterium]MBT8310582.1 hypothetical protein [Bacteroidia bacterium]NNK26803.1 hypothetical protein [Flavobacteriaceae bacterium]NNL61252.1 hypothetical protein [Flavobacteriaceae bacterium]
MQLPNTFEELVEGAQEMNLYKKLVAQLNKDFLYANIDLDFDEEILPTSLKLLLHECVYRLIQEKFSEYLNLLYIIDVPEDKVRQLDGTDMLKLSEQVTFLILTREWQKVWLRNNYKTKK